MCVCKREKQGEEEGEGEGGRERERGREREGRRESKCNRISMHNTNPGHSRMYVVNGGKHMLMHVPFTCIIT